MDSSMDSDIARYENDRRARLREVAKSALLREGEDPKVRVLRFKLALKKPGIKALLGDNPLANEEFDELEKYFRLSKERV